MMGLGMRQRREVGMRERRRLAAGLLVRQRMVKRIDVTVIPDCQEPQTLG